MMSTLYNPHLTDYKVSGIFGRGACIPNAHIHTYQVYCNLTSQYFIPIIKTGSTNCVHTTIRTIHAYSTQWKHEFSSVASFCWFGVCCCCVAEMRGMLFILQQKEPFRFSFGFSMVYQFMTMFVSKQLCVLPTAQSLL